MGIKDLLRHADKTRQAQIKRLQQNGSSSHNFTVCWIPCRTLLSDNILEESGVLGEANVTELNLYFQPLESDLLSLELENAFSELYLVSTS